MPLRFSPLSSVPMEMHDRCTRISAVPGSITGAGTSSATAMPRRIKICFTSDRVAQPVGAHERVDGRQAGRPRGLSHRGAIEGQQPPSPAAVMTPEHTLHGVGFSELLV